MLKVCLDVQIRSPFLSPYSILHSCWVVGTWSPANPSQIKYGQHRPSDSHVNPSHSSHSSFGSIHCRGIHRRCKRAFKTVQCSFFLSRVLKSSWDSPLPGFLRLYTGWWRGGRVSLRARSPGCGGRWGGCGRFCSSPAPAEPFPRTAGFLTARPCSRRDLRDIAAALTTALVVAWYVSNVIRLCFYLSPCAYCISNVGRLANALIQSDLQ